MLDAFSLVGPTSTKYKAVPMLEAFSFCFSKNAGAHRAHKRVCDAFCQILSLALICLMMPTHSDWHGTRMASTRRGSQAETMSCHRARVRIASSTGATSRYSKFSLTRGCCTRSTWRWPTCATLRRRGRSGRINRAKSFCHQA